jgi:hypothetical protein
LPDGEGLLCRDWYRSRLGEPPEMSMVTRAEHLGGTGVPFRNSWRLQGMEIERSLRRVGKDRAPGTGAADWDVDRRPF